MPTEQTDGQTDGRQTVTLRFLHIQLDALSGAFNEFAVNGLFEKFKN